MADTDNPYQAGGGADVAADHRTLLAQTQPWLILIGVISALGATLVLLGALGVGLMSLAGLAMGTQDSEFAAFGAAGGVMMITITGFYAVIGGVYAAFAYFLIRQGMAIARYRGSGSADDLTVILRAHRDFWRLAGIMTLIGITLYCALIAFMFSAGAAMQSVFQDVGSIP